MEPDHGRVRVPAVTATTDVGDPLVVSRSKDFATFYRDSHKGLCRAMTVTLANRDLAIEAIDEGMVRAYQHWNKVHRLDNPGGWVYRVSLNWATSVLRRRRLAVRFASSAGSMLDRDVPAPVAGEPDVFKAIGELDIRQRSVVVCRYLLAYTEAETADALSMPAGTVKSRLSRANRHLSDRLSHLRKDV